MVSKRLLLLILVTIYESACETHDLKCKNKNKIITVGSLNKVSACIINDYLEITNENATIKITDTTSEMSVFSIKDQEIWYIPDGIQKSIPNLKGLQIVNSKLKKISADNFKNMTSLVFLDLSGNEIQELDKDLFQNNAKLAEIQLNDNQINKIHPSALIGLQMIKKLDLEDNICFDGKFDNIEVATIFKKVSITCWNQHELSEKIEELQKKLITMSSLESHVISLNKDFNSISLKLSSLNISVHPVEDTTTSTKPDSYIADSLNIKISSIIPVPFTSLDVTLVNCGVITLIFILLLCYMCCRKTPKPTETLKTIVVKSSDYDRMKEMTTLRRSVHPGKIEEDHQHDVPLKIKSQADQIRAVESVGSFDDILDEEQSGIQTDWSVAYKTESDEKV
ncbi:hypothetical protein ACKWTF_014174 [Chironomus riparius]